MVLHQVPIVVPFVVEYELFKYDPFHNRTNMKKHLVHEHIIELTKYKVCVKEVENGDDGG
jgi:hypothetical protein